MSKTYDHYYAVIMAGGGGTRLWPLSRRKRPKQMLDLLGERSLFQIAVDRLEGLFPPERICVATVAEQAAALQAQCPAIPAENYFIEPLPRGTASVVGLAAAALRQRSPDAVMAVLTADHFIANVERFRRVLRAAYHASQDASLVTLGITPTYAATGYGYIEIGELLYTSEDLPVHRALKFKEKPDAKRARAFLSDGRHAWNSGMFVWRVDAILEEIARQMPDLHAGVGRISEAWQTRGAQPRQVVRAVWEELQSQTVDYGIMERARRVVVIPAADLGWSDVGSWDAVFDVLEHDAQGNAVRQARHIGLDTRNTLIFDATASERLFVTIGVQDLVLVDTGDVVLVCRRDQAQKVREVVRSLKESGAEHWL